jgi:hypothetical protein
MNKEDSLQFVQERLRLSHSAFHRDIHLRPAPRVTRRLAIELAPGETQRFDHVDGTVLIVCAHGHIWATHDGDPKDVVLGPGESYRCQREDALHVFALQPSVIEIEFEDALLH